MESDQQNIYAEIGKEINEGLDVSGKTLDDRIKHLMKAEEMILNQDDTSILDNFLDEMFQFMHQKDQKIRCFVISFIEKACKKDPEVMKKAISTLSWPMSESGMWVVQRRNDKEVEQCWNIFCQLKGRIMQTMDSDNEGIRFMAFKFLETVILCQTAKTELSENVNSPYQMSLDEISRDHSFISYRMLASEAAHSFDCLLQQLASSHISSLNLVTVISCLCTVAKQRPEYFPQVISALESLHVNLPPTLGTSQVKSVRKELKMHLLRMLKHPASLSHLHLGNLESNPATNEVKEMLKKKLAEAKEAAMRNSSSSNLGLPRTRQAEEAMDTDLRDPKRLKLDDDEYEDSGDIFKQLDDLESASSATQKAVEITTNFVLERLTNQVVTKLVILCLYTLPDQMPAAFASTYTPIDGAGSDVQKRHLARMLAIQLTKEGEGPGIQYIKEEKQKLFVARQFARSEGAFIPPTLHNDRSQDAIGSAMGKIDINKFAQPQMLSTMKSKARLQNFNLFSITRELLPQEAESMFVHAFQRIMNNEKRAVQGGATLAQQKILVRLVTRFHSIRTKELEAMLLNFIVNDQKNRTDLALLWLAELYAQLQGYSICMSSFSPGNFSRMRTDTFVTIRCCAAFCRHCTTEENIKRLYFIAFSSKSL
uniref:Symplekin/Pta1 N-terminal domain-containing protein n=1 Tax=Ditylenchus dipsaci TaxID=166011 RepID=A0A915DEG5_9BILA